MCSSLHGRASAVNVALVTFAMLLCAHAPPPVFVVEKMPFHNPEHSCPTAREVDWPLIKAELKFYAEEPIETRRSIQKDADTAFQWRIWVARVYVSNDIDFCPLGLQTVHLVDVDRRISEFTPTGLAEVFEAQYLHYTTRIPLFLTALSGWPIFRLYSQAVEEARRMPNFPQFIAGAPCGGAVQMADIMFVIRGIFDTVRPEGATELMKSLARILTAAEAVKVRSEDEQAEDPDGQQVDDCALAVAFAHFGRAVVFAQMDVSAAPPEGIERFMGKIMQAVEAGEEAWHSTVEAALKRGKLFGSEAQARGFLRAYGAWPLWDLLDKLQVYMSRKPWALRCAGSRVESSLCPACAKPHQAEWVRESQWVTGLAAAGARGEFGHPYQQRYVGALLADAAGGPAAAGRAAVEERLRSPEALEAWATLLSDDDAIANEANREALLTYLEAIRVMARSVRLAEEALVGEKARINQRHFLVMMPEAALTEEVRAVLEGDGLMPFVLSNFSSEGVEVPLRRKQRGELGAASSEENGSEEASGEMELSWWLKIKLWKLTQYRRIVYIDADTLVNRPIDELFALPEDVDFAAPVHLSRDGEGSDMSVGIMSLRPSLRIYNALVAFLSEAASHFSTGLRSVDQTLQHSFFARFFAWRGYPGWDPSGNFLGCGNDLPELHAGAEVLGAYKPQAEPEAERLGAVCILPPRYDFCVSYPALVAGMDSSDFQEELATQWAQPEESLQGGAFGGWLRAGLLHWTGPRRKPWMHYLSLSRTAFDSLWWDAHAELCEHARAAASEAHWNEVRPKPCQIQC